MNRLISSSFSSARLLSNSSRNMSVKKVSHCIFDMDGLLLDTESLYYIIFKTILSRYGKEYTWEMKQSVMGMQSEDTCRKIVELFQLPITWQEYESMIKDLELDMLTAYVDFMPDTEPIYENMVGDIAKAYNKPYTWDVRMRILGTTEQMTAKLAVNELHLPISVEEFRRQFTALGWKRLGNAGKLRGAERLIKHLHKTNVPFALATSSSQEMAELKMQKHKDIFDLFHHKVMGSTDPDVILGKPAPDIFLVAAQRFPDKPDPANCLVFEDAPNGVRAAVLAGMQSVMVPDKHVAEELRQEATIVLDTLDQFQPEMFGLPPFDNDNNNS